MTKRNMIGEKSKGKSVSFSWKVTLSVAAHLHLMTIQQSIMFIYCTAEGTLTGPRAPVLPGCLKVYIKKAQIALLNSH